MHKEYNIIGRRVFNILIDKLVETIILQRQISGDISCKWWLNDHIIMITFDDPICHACYSKLNKLGRCTVRYFSMFMDINLLIYTMDFIEETDINKMLSRDCKK